MGALVTFAGVSTYPDGVPIRGNLDRPMSIGMTDGGIGGAQMSAPELRLPYNAFDPMPDAGDVLEIDGVPYQVTTPTAEDDGAVLIYEVSRIS